MAEATVKAVAPPEGDTEGVMETTATATTAETAANLAESTEQSAEIVEGKSSEGDSGDLSKTGTDGEGGTAKEEEKNSEAGKADTTTTEMVEGAGDKESSGGEQTAAESAGDQGEGGEGSEGEGKEVKVEEGSDKKEEDEEKVKTEEGEPVVEGDGGEAVETEGDIRVEEGVTSGGDEEIDGDKEVADDAAVDEGEEDQPITTEGVTEVINDTEAVEEISDELGHLETRVQHTANPAEESVTILTAIKEEEEEEDDQEELRQELIEQIMRALEEKKELESQRDKVEHYIAEHLAQKAEKDQPDITRAVPDARKYAIVLNKIRELRTYMEKAQERQSRKEEKLTAKMNSDLEQAKSAREHLLACRRERFIGLLNSRTGKRITMADLDHYHSLEEEKEEEIKKIRLNNIKLAAKMSKLSESLRQKEQLAQGLHMIDFEQLKINNIDLNEKIEERNDDILKLKKKVTSTVQVLTHVKEKLQFLQLEKAERRAALSEIEAKLAMKRDELTHLKQARDALRADNQRLKQKGGLVSHKALLRDFEEKIDETEEMRQRLEMLQKRHSELSVMCEGLRRKIETAKMLEAEALANR